MAELEAITEVQADPRKSAIQARQYGRRFPLAPGKPIHLGSEITTLLGFTPGGQTLYAGTVGTVIPISTATNTPGQPIHVGGTSPPAIAITP